MRYRRFEIFVLVIGGGAVLAALAMTYTRHPDITEAAAQILLLVVLAAAVHWGRKGGMVAALAASLIYFVLRLPLALRLGGLTSDIVLLLLTRFLTYGVIGIGGGELCSRVKYFFTESERGNAIDSWTHVYNQGHMSRLLENAHGQHARYGTPYALVVVDLSPALTEGLRPSRQRSLLRAATNHIRGDVRLVDDVGRLDDGRFAVLLPHTGKEGALVAAERVRGGVRDVLGAKDESVTARALSCAEDAEEIAALRSALAETAQEAQESGS